MTSNVDAIRQLFGPHVGGIGAAASNLPVFDGIFPEYDAPLITTDGAGTRLGTMRWGWPPFGELKRPITNVRNLQSPMWRAALHDPQRRCLVPVTAFCEYATRPDPQTGRKPQHWFGLASGDPFAFAGIWRPSEDGARFAFLTCEPNALVARVHPKAMPVMLVQDDLGRWLRDDWSLAQQVVRPFDQQSMCELEMTAPPASDGLATMSQPSLFD